MPSSQLWVAVLRRNTEGHAKMIPIYRMDEAHDVHGSMVNERKLGNEDRQTDRQADRQTNRQTD